MCPAGTYTAEEGSSNCTACASGAFSAAGSSDCHGCDYWSDLAYSSGGCGNYSYCAMSKNPFFAEMAQVCLWS